MKAGTASFEEKKKRQTVKMKKLSRLVIPCIVLPGFMNKVAIMNPMMVNTMSRDINSSGVLLMFIKFLRIRTHDSSKKEFANLEPKWLYFAEFGALFGVR